MKIIAFILLAALLVSQTLTQPPVFDIVGPLSATAFGCLAQEGFQQVIIRAYSLDNGGSLDPNAVQTLLNAQNSGINPYIYMVICRNGDAASQVDTILDQISTRNYGMAYIKVEPNTVPGCQWSSSVPADNCGFITAAINEFTNNGMAAGIFTTANIWKSFFAGGCDIISTLAPLWYANYDSSGQLNSDPSFADFISFGGWQGASLKQTAGEVHVTNLCGNSGWHAFIDIDANYPAPV